MSKPKPKVIVILGQTATGKSDLAVLIAKAFAVSGVESEIISADSRQVYTGLDIGSGKITKKEMCGVPHHLLDVVNPKNKFSVVEYKKLADERIREIIARGHVPIICGGTGFYIDAVVNNIVLPEVPPNMKLRKELDKKSNESLLKLLQKIDPVRATTIDSKNKVRLIRAIEIAKALGRVPPLRQGLRGGYDFIKIGLHAPTEFISQKIEKRLTARIKSGMLREAQKLHKANVSWKRMEELGLEYRFMALYLKDKITKQEMLEKLQTAIIQYSKRQMTWFKRDKNIHWVDVSRKLNFAKILKLL